MKKDDDYSKRDELQLSGKLELIEITLRKSLKKTLEMLNSQAAIIWIKNLADNSIKIAACAGVNKISEIKLNLDVKSDILKVLVSDKDFEDFADRNVLQEFEKRFGFYIQNMLCMSLKKDNEYLGCLQILNKKQNNQFSKLDREILKNVSDLLLFTVSEYNVLSEQYMEKKKLISLYDLKKTYISGKIKTPVLKGINLDIYRGESVVILGKSGCGKTTLLNIVGGMDYLTDGKFLFENRDYSKASESLLTDYRRNNVGFIFQTYNLMPNLTAKENLEFIAALCKKPLDSDEILSVVGLSEQKNSYPSQLSGGQQQRVSVARALIKNPQIILADEPTAALDYANSIEVLDVMQRIVEKGATLLTVTHNEEIAKMADRVIRLKDGIVESIVENQNPCSARELKW